MLSKRLKNFSNSMRNKKIVCVSGYFDPLHVGHLEYFKAAKELGDELWVIVNNDEQAKLKKGRPFMNQWDRLRIVSAIKWVDWAVIAVDRDRSVCKTLEILKPDIFANGGDRTKKNIPEVSVCKKLGIKMVFNVGGSKLNSSSKLLKNYYEQMENFNHRSRANR